MEKDSAESELAPSPFRSYPAAKRAEEPEKRLIPKFPAIKRSSNKTTPFILKRVSVSSELEKKFAPPIQPPVSAADALFPTVISPISIRVPSRPAVVSPVTVPRFGELPKVLSPRTVEITLTASVAPPAAAAVTEPVSAPLAAPLAAPAAAKISAVNPKISLEDINREFARSRTRAEKTRRRRFRSPLINGEIREELKDEYYWEILSDESETARKNTKGMRDDPLRNLVPRRVYGVGGESVSLNERTPEPNLLSAALVEPVILIGHVTLLALSPFQHLWKQKDASAFEKKSRPRPGGKKNNRVRPVDFIIALVCGVVIAMAVVFPMLKKFGNGIYESVQKSNVRRLGGVVSVSKEEPAILNMLIESPEIIGELNGTFTPRAAEISEINVSESSAPPLSADPWESEPVPFNNAEWSGALLNEFESPEAESDRGGK
ncbi:MAG: hypothetical protein J6S40_09140 [Thermoguttaceae bacterium]|nr:hypothetical protein [Thermoguttaceae bacterium]